MSARGALTSRSTVYETLAACSLAAELGHAGHSVAGPARSSGEAIALARDRHPKLALIDISRETNGAGVRLARQLRVELDMLIIFATGQARVARENADCAIGFITKPFCPEEVPDILRYADARIRGEDPPSPPYLLSFELFS